MWVLPPALRWAPGVMPLAVPSVSLGMSARRTGMETGAFPAPWRDLAPWGHPGCVRTAWGLRPGLCSQPGREKSGTGGVRIPLPGARIPLLGGEVRTTLCPTPTWDPRPGSAALLGGTHGGIWARRAGIWHNSHPTVGSVPTAALAAPLCSGRLQGWAGMRIHPRDRMDPSPGTPPQGLGSPWPGSVARGEGCDATPRLAGPLPAPRPQSRPQTGSWVRGAAAGPAAGAARAAGSGVRR